VTSSEIVDYYFFRGDYCISDISTRSYTGDWNNT